MADWREAAYNMGQVALTQKREGNISTVLPKVLDNLRAFGEAQRAGKAAGEKELRGYGQEKTMETMRANAALSKSAYENVFANDPNAARGMLGMEEMDFTGGTGPGGLRLTKKVVNGMTYEVPEELDETTLAKIYSDYAQKVQAHNASQYVQVGMSQPIQIPTYASFVSEYFPEYLQNIKSGTNAPGMVRGPKAIDPVVATIISSARQRGMPDAEIANQLKSSKKYAGLNPKDYGLIK